MKLQSKYNRLPTMCHEIKKVFPSSVDVPAIPGEKELLQNGWIEALQSSAIEGIQYNGNTSNGPSAEICVWDGQSSNSIPLPSRVALTNNDLVIRNFAIVSFAAGIKGVLSDEWEDAGNALTPPRESPKKLMSFLLKWHGVLYRGYDRKEPGKIRTLHVYIGNAISVVHIPPPPFAVPFFLDALSEFVPNTLLEAWCWHAEFETIHPFVDGNGRIGRAALVYHLGRLGIYPFWSDTIHRHRPYYYRFLQAWQREDAQGVASELSLLFASIKK